MLHCSLILNAFIIDVNRFGIDIRRRAGGVTAWREESFHILFTILGNMFGFDDNVTQQCSANMCCNNALAMGAPRDACCHRNRSVPFAEHLQNIYFLFFLQ